MMRSNSNRNIFLVLLVAAACQLLVGNAVANATILATGTESMCCMCGECRTILFGRATTPATVSEDTCMSLAMDMARGATSGHRRTASARPCKRQVQEQLLRQRTTRRRRSCRPGAPLPGRATEDTTRFVSIVQLARSCVALRLFFLLLLMLRTGNITLLFCSSGNESGIGNRTPK